MHAKKLVLLCVLSMTTGSSALDEHGRAAGEKLVQLLKAELEEIGGLEENRDLAFPIHQYLRQVQATLARERNREIEQTLDNFGNYQPTAGVSKQIEALREALLDEVRTNTRAKISELENLLASAREKVTRALEAEELDKVIVSLSRNPLANQSDDAGYDTNHATIRRLASEIGNTRQFVTTWQDYIHASNSGNVSQASQLLRNLASQENTIIPRSQILDRIEFERKSAEEDVAEAIAGIKTLDDMRAAIEKLKGHSANRSSDSNVTRESLRTLVALEKTYREFLAGLPVNVAVLQPPPGSSEEGADFTRLRGKTRTINSARSLDLPTEMTANPGEPVDDFLKRALADAAKRGDEAAQRRIHDFTLTFARAGTLNQAELDALRSFSAGENQMKAGQYLLAVVSLQEALKSGSDLVPAKKAGELLAGIRKEHPEEFEQGMMEFLTDRPTPEFDYSRMRYRNYMPPGYPGGDPRRGGTTVVLPVPEKDAKKE